jgi:hypothetical protein
MRGTLAVVGTTVALLGAMAPAAMAKACDEIGATDPPASYPNVVYPPRLDETLYPRRADGRLPIGFNDPGMRSPLFRAKRLDMQKRAGGELTRFDVPWAAKQPNATPEPDWSETDGAYCDAVHKQVAPVLVIVTKPSWASNDDLRKFAFKVAARYPRAAAIEAWNEPNLAPVIAPADYVPMLQAIYSGVKNGDPEHDMPVLGGALGVGSGSSTLGNYLAAMYTYGAASAMDAIAFHVYGDPTQNYSGRDIIGFEVNDLKAAIPAAEQHHRRL